MRILHSLATVTILALAASAAGAAPHAAQPGQVTIIQENASLMGAPGMAYLQLSSMSLEIQAVLDQASETEQLLLKELAAATEDEQAMRLIRRIERLEADRTLAILKIQARYARLEGRWDLEYQLRARIMEVLEQEVYAVK